MAHPMGESKEEVLRVDFDRRVKLEFHGSNVTSEAGLLPYRELDDVVELTEMAGDVLADGRTGKNGRHGMIGQLRPHPRAPAARKPRAQSHGEPLAIPAPDPSLEPCLQEL